MKPKLIRITTVPLSLQKLIAGQMEFMSRNEFEVFMISSPFDGQLALERKENAIYIPIAMTRVISPLADLKSLYNLVKAFRQIKPDIVHTHTPKAGLLGMLAARIVGVPVRLHTVAGLPLMEARGLKRIVLEAIEKITYACAHQVYPNSSNLKEFIIASNFTSSAKLKVIGNGSSNGINVNLFQLTDDIASQVKVLQIKHHLNADHFIFVFVGRLVKDKGIEELVSAFSALAKQYPKMRLLLVGPEESDLDPLSMECRTEIYDNPAIIHVGYQNDVKPYLALSQVLTFPSYREGFPNVPMQAGCFGLPCIVSNINGCNEIIENDKNGVIIPVKDTVSIKEAMDRVYLDTELYDVMKSNARKMIVERYDQQKVWDLILREYQYFLKRNNVV
jgi:glycosyltransferase involved in cell wall biosynthesis